MKYDILQTALKALRNGKTLLYPTDTIWGIGCDATNAQAVEQIYAIKKRDHSKSMLILVNEQMLSDNLSQEVWGLLRAERPTTVILPVEQVTIPIADNLPASNHTVGVRIPQFDFCQQLLAQFGRPIVSTSANFSGHPSPSGYHNIADDLKSRISCCLPDDDTFHHPDIKSSRIVKLSPSGETIIIRD